MPTRPSLAEALRKHRVSGQTPMRRKGPQASYDPNKEAMFANILASGGPPVGPDANWASRLGDAGQILAAYLGSRQQGKARTREEEAQDLDKQASRLRAWRVCSVASGWMSGRATSGPSQENPALLGETLQRSRPEAPTPDNGVTAT